MATPATLYEWRAELDRLQWPHGRVMHQYWAGYLNRVRQPPDGRPYRPGRFERKRMSADQLARFYEDLAPGSKVIGYPRLHGGGPAGALVYHGQWPLHRGAHVTAVR